MLATHTYSHPDITSRYAGDFNCQHVNWGYSTTSLDGEKLASWAKVNNLALLQDPKGVARFSSHRWNVDTNADLAFANVGHGNRPRDRRVLGNFWRSQHQPSLIMPPKFLQRSGEMLEVWQG